MKVTKKTYRDAKVIFKAVLINGQIDKPKLTKVVDLLLKEDSKNILAVLMKLLEHYEKNQELLLESPFPLNSLQEETLKTDFEKLTSKKLKLVTRENKDLIAGIRVTQGDYVWENSVVSNLNQLKGVIINE